MTLYTNRATAKKPEQYTNTKLISNKNYGEKKPDS